MTRQPAPSSRLDHLQPQPIIASTPVQPPPSPPLHILGAATRQHRPRTAGKSSPCSAGRHRTSSSPEAAAPAYHCQQPQQRMHRTAPPLNHGLQRPAAVPADRSAQTRDLAMEGPRSEPGRATTSPAWSAGHATPPRTRRAAAACRHARAGAQPRLHARRNTAAMPAAVPPSWPKPLAPIREACADTPPRPPRAPATWMTPARSGATAPASSRRSDHRRPHPADPH
jgi:hypothetical protein